VPTAATTHSAGTSQNADRAMSRTREEWRTPAHRRTGPSQPASVPLARADVGRCLGRVLNALSGTRGAGPGAAPCIGGHVPDTSGFLYVALPHSPQSTNYSRDDTHMRRQRPVARCQFIRACLYVVERGIWTGCAVKM
jgi:hypothetical protein